MIGWSFTVPKGRRTFHHLAVFVLTTASIAYFSMASDLGATPVVVEFYDFPFTRQIWYARYIQWFITTPCLLLMLVLVTGLPLSDIIALIFFGLVMVVSFLIGALIPSSYKWGYFAFGCASLIYVWWMLIGPALKSSRSLGPEFRKAYVGSAIYLASIWTLYPISWGLSEGGNRITPTSEMIFYGILDLLTKPVFCFFHVWMVSRLDYSRLQLQSGKFSEGYGSSPFTPITSHGTHGTHDTLHNNGAANGVHAGMHEKGGRGSVGAPNVEGGLGTGIHGGVTNSPHEGAGVHNDVSGLNNRGTHNVGSGAAPALAHPGASDATVRPTV